MASIGIGQGGVEIRIWLGNLNRSQRHGLRCNASPIEDKHGKSAKACGYRSGGQVDAALRDFGIKHTSGTDDSSRPPIYAIVALITLRGCSR
jgi:hypothetical protein